MGGSSSQLKKTPDEVRHSQTSLLTAPFQRRPLNVAVIGFKGSGQTSLCASQARFDEDLSKETSIPELLDFDEFILYKGKLEGRTCDSLFRLFDFDAHWCHSCKWARVMRRKVRLKVDCIACVIDSTQFPSVSTGPSLGSRAPLKQWSIDVFPLWDVYAVVSVWAKHSLPTEATESIARLIDKYCKTQRSITQPQFISEDLLSQACDYRNADGTQPALLIWANFQDLDNAAKKEAIVSEIGKSIMDEAFGVFEIQESSALTGDGLLQGLRYIYNSHTKLQKPSPRSKIAGLMVAL